MLLCEDSQHEAFARRFLSGMGWETREMRVERGRKGLGSGEHWVRSRFPTELAEYRNRTTRAATALIAIIDADSGSVLDHIGELSDACAARKVAFRTANEAVAIAAPKRNIETWIHHLRGETVDEMTRYPKLQNPSECGDAVDALLEQCHGGGLKSGTPESLTLACNEYSNKIDPVRRA